MRVFISHSSQDLSEARELKSALETRGVSCWLAPDEIEFASDYAKRLIEGIRTCDATIVVLSRASMESRHVRREIEIADGFNHKFYPVRLLDLILVQEFSYFMRPGQWIDLFDGDTTTRYDELADAIKERRTLQRQRDKRQTHTLWAALTLTIAVISVSVAGFLLFQNRIQDALNGEVLFKDPFPNSYLEVWQDKSSTSELTGLSDIVFYLSGFPHQINPVEVTVIDSSNNIVGRHFSIPKTRDSLLEVRTPVLTNSETLMICFIFESNEKARYALVKKVSIASTYDANRKIIELNSGDDCISTLGVSESSVDLEILNSAMMFADLERKHAFVTIDGIGIYPRDAHKYDFRFSTKGGQDGTSSVPNSVEVVLETGPNKQRWPKNDVFLHGEDGRFQRIVTYQRPLDRFVRICVTTRLGPTEWAVHQERVFELTGDKTDYLATIDVTRPTVNEDPHWCRRSRDPAKTEIHAHKNIDPLQEALPKSGGIKSITRIDALKRILEGSATPYGWGVDGLWLGMPFNLAMSRAMEILPKATTIKQNQPYPLDQRQLTLGVLVTLEDKQRGRLISLLQSASGKGPSRLVAAYISYNSDPFQFTQTELRSRINQLYGTSKLIGEENYSDTTRMQWSETNQKCVYWKMHDSNALGLDADSSDSCSQGLFVNVRHYEGGRGSGNVAIGIYDFPALSYSKFQ